MERQINKEQAEKQAKENFAKSQNSQESPLKIHSKNQKNFLNRKFLGC